MSDLLKPNWTPEMIAYREKRQKAATAPWRWLAIADCDWRRWGLGVEFSLGYWWPREWSVYLHIGPFLLGIGREEDIYFEEAPRG